LIGQFLYAYSQIKKSPEHDLKCRFLDLNVTETIPCIYTVVDF